MIKNTVVKISLALLLFSGLTLPFHWVPSEPLLIPKQTLTYSRTFVTKNDAIQIVKQYYQNTTKKKTTNLDPLTQALINHWKIKKTKNGDTLYQHTSN